MQQLVRWGILGTAKIAREKVIPGIHISKKGLVQGIASRYKDRAYEVAEELDIPLALSYDNLLASDEIDAIYIPLPNHLHVPWTQKALQAGKHVLCEKPLALTFQEAEQLYNETRKYPKLKVMEAFMYRFHPQWQKAKALVENGDIGKLITIQSFFSYFNNDPDNIRNMTDIGGGALMDIGCYPVSLSRFLFADEPVNISAVMDIDAEFKTDRHTSATMRFKNGTATFTCSTQCAPYQRVNILGTDGRIEIEIPFNAPHNKPTRLWLHTADGIKEIEFDICDQYALQADAFADAVMNNADTLTPLSDAVANMKVIDQIRETATKTENFV